MVDFASAIKPATKTFYCINASNPFASASNAVIPAEPKVSQATSNSQKVRECDSAHYLA